MVDLRSATSCVSAGAVAASVTSCARGRRPVQRAPTQPRDARQLALLVPQCAGAAPLERAPRGHAVATTEITPLQMFTSLGVRYIERSSEHI